MISWDCIAKPFRIMDSFWKEQMTLNPPTVIGGFDNFEIHKIGLKYFSVFDTITHTYALHATLKKKQKTINTYEVYLVGVKPSYRGQNIAVRFYTSLIKNLNIILLSGDRQSNDGKKLWAKLAKVKGIQLAGYDLLTKKVFPIDTEDLLEEDLWGSQLDFDIQYAICELDELTSNRHWNKVYKHIVKLQNSKRHIDKNIRIIATTINR